MRPLAGLAAVLLLLGMELATVHRATAPGELGALGSGGAWVSLWLVGGGLAIVALAYALEGLLGEQDGLPLKPAAAPVVLATAVAVGLGGLGTGLVALPVAAMALGAALREELPGWGGVVAVAFAVAPGVLAQANELWLVAVALGLLALVHPAGLAFGIVAGLLDPLVGLGLGAFGWAAGRGRFALAPAVVALWPLSQHLDASDPLLAPALGLVIAAIALGWPFAAVGLLTAPAPWQAMAGAMLVGTALVGPEHAQPLVVPIAAGCFCGTVAQLGRRRALALWMATVLVVGIGYTPRVLQLPDLGSMLQ